MLSKREKCARQCALTNMMMSSATTSSAIQDDGNCARWRKVSLTYTFAYAISAQSAFSQFSQFNSTDTQRRNCGRRNWKPDGTNELICGRRFNQFNRPNTRSLARSINQSISSATFVSRQTRPLFSAYSSRPVLGSKR